jgi:hypothetical protein
MKARFFISLAMALLAFLLPRILFSHNGIAVMVSFMLAACWIVVLIAGIFRFKKRGLWLLVGAPFALFWPVSLFLVVQSCAHNVKACL